MDTNSLVIISGLIAALLAYSAVQDSDSAAAPPAMRWRLAESWTTSAAALAALTAVGFLGAEDDGVMVMFAFILLLGPILYKGFSGMGSASMSLFVTVGTLMAWATLAILTRVSMLIFSTTRAELTVVPRLVLNTVVIGALLAAAGAIYTGLRSAAQGTNLTADGAWTLP